MTACRCDERDADLCYSECEVHVHCDDNCRALIRPRTVEELRDALAHWHTHSYLGGCAHGC